MHNTQYQQKRTFNQRLRTITASALCVLTFISTPSAFAGNGNGNNGNGNGNQGQGNQGQGQGNQGQWNQGQGNAGNLRRNVRPVADQHHVSPDLNNAIRAANVPNVRWARNTTRGRLVQVVITANNSGDRMLAALRRAILIAGGSVHRRYDNLGTLYALLPAPMVALIAARPDVINIAPNRTVIGTSSFLEQTTGAADVRTSVGVAPALDGTGIGIAVLDSGIMDAHAAFNGANGRSRVVAHTDLTGLTPDWTQGVDTSGNPTGGGGNSNPDPYGHGTFVASVAAGANVGNGLDSTGIAPGASLVDVRVLDDNGQGDLATTLAGINWVLANAQQYNIRVLNISLGTDPNDSYVNDPLCIAVREAVAAGITVVVAAGNYGLSSDGRLIYGSISSPGDEPSAITVGSMKSYDTTYRGDDTVNNFSSKGPTRGSYVDANLVTQYDNLLKPDLVAPGNRVVGAISSDPAGQQPSLLSVQNPSLILQSQPANTGLMLGSGTSFSTPVVSGTVALLLQANPGLTPPLVKAILQYTAQAVGTDTLVQQGAGIVDVPGAVAVAQSLSTTIAAQVASGTINVGDSLLAPGQQLPAPVSNVGGQTVNWSQFAVMGGFHVLYGSNLLTQYQAIYDPTLLWVGNTVDSMSLTYAGNGTTVTGYTTNSVVSGNVVTPGVSSLDAALGSSDPDAGTGMFTPSANVLGDVATAVGTVYTSGLTLSQSLVASESAIVSESAILSESLVSSESLIVSESLIGSESLVSSEAGPVMIGRYSMAGE
jgi:subtilisin family serine protease